MASRTANTVSFEDARARSGRTLGLTSDFASGRAAGRYTSSLSLAGGSRASVGLISWNGRGSSRDARDAREVRDVRDVRDAEAFAESDDYPNERTTRASRAERSGSTSRAEDRRRKRTKERAEKMFNLQFATDSAAATEEDAPRAAVYEGKMGSRQRKSTRMQRSSSAGSPSAKIDPAGWFANLGVTPRILKMATVAICAVLTCVLLYVPAQQYYQAQREHDRLAAEYSTIEKRNDALDVQNDILASDAGIEDAVRQKYGYVKVGEQTAVVTGLSENATDTSRDGEDIEANVLSGSVKSPEQWYTPLLDAFFGVE